VVEPERATRTLALRRVRARGSATGVATFRDLRVERLDPLSALLQEPALPDAEHPWARRLTVDRVTSPALLAPAGATWAVGVTGPRTFTARVVGLQDGTRVRVSQPDGGASVDVELDEDGEASVSTSVQPGELRLTTESGLAAWMSPRLWGAPDPRPDLLVVVVDTLRADRLGRGLTPALDGLAERSLVFTEARAPSGWTAASLGSLVTGTWPSTHRAGLRVARELKVTRANATTRRRNQLNHEGLSDQIPTLAEQLRDAGYETVGIHTNYFFSTELGFDRGFDRYHYYRGNNLKGADNGVALAEQVLADRAADAPPLLLVLHLVDPHLPYRLRDEVADQPTEDLEALRDGAAIVIEKLTPALQADPSRIEAVYDGEVAWIDQAFAKLWSAAEALDPAVVFVSDHGEAFGEHDAWIHGNTLYDELLRVPLMLRLPGDAAVGRRDERVSLVDVAPTLRALAGLPVEGIDLREPVPERTLWAEAMYSGPDRSAVLEGRWKLVWTWPKGWLGVQQDEPAWRKADKKRGTAELFDLDADPREVVDLAEQHPEVVERLTQELHERIAATASGLHVRCDEATTVELTASGSITALQPVVMHGASKVRLHATRRSASLELAAGDWVIARAAGELSASACATWTVAGADGGLAVDAEALEELEALGYVE